MPSQSGQMRYRSGAIDLQAVKYCFPGGGRIDDGTDPLFPLEQIAGIRSTVPKRRCGRGRFYTAKTLKVAQGNDPIFVYIRSTYVPGVEGKGVYGPSVSTRISGVYRHVPHQPRLASFVEMMSLFDSDEE